MLAAELGGNHKKFGTSQTPDSIVPDPTTLLSKEKVVKKESKPGRLKQEEATHKVAIRVKKEEGLVLSCMEAKNPPKTGKDCKATQNRREPLHCLRNI